MQLKTMAVQRVRQHEREYDHYLIQWAPLGRIVSHFVRMAVDQFPDHAQMSGGEQSSAVEQKNGARHLFDFKQNVRADENCFSERREMMEKIDIVAAAHWIETV